MTARLSTADIPEVFADLTPVSLGDDGVAAIDYNSEDYFTSYGYFAAALQADERSERLLQLTATCLLMNPANYTVWHRRRECWRYVWGQTPETLTTELETEFSFTASLGGSNPKNYQIWYHRRALLDEYLVSGDGKLHMGLWNTEIAYIDSVLTNDSKNYHAWSNRLWLLRKGCSCIEYCPAVVDNIGQLELEATAQYLEDDVRNNSAWNHRWSAHHVKQPQQQLPMEAANTELSYVVQQIERDPHNESSWRYLVALVKEQNDGAFIEQALGLIGSNTTTSSFAQAATVDLLESQTEHPEGLRKAVKLCEDLSRETDAIRRSYWEARCRDLQARMIV